MLRRFAAQTRVASLSWIARDFAERDLWNIGLWRFHCAFDHLVRKREQFIWYLEPMALAVLRLITQNADRFR